MNAYRASAFRLPVPVRNGESMTYSRAGRISPVLSDLSPSLNTNYDNGVSPIGGVGASAPTYPFEQWSVFIGMYPYFMDLNMVQNQETIASVFKQNVDNLAENAALSLDLQLATQAFGAYLSGNTWVLAAAGADSTTLHVDNGVGLLNAFAQVTINGNSFASGMPQAVSVGNPQTITVYPASGSPASLQLTVTGWLADSVNASSMASVGGVSGTLTVATNTYTSAEWDVIVAADAPAIYRPNGKQSMANLTAADTLGAQLIINAVSELRANGVRPPLANGTYPCYIDPIVAAQFFTDQQFQIMSVGQYESEDFRGAKVNQNFGVTFIPTTNSPSISFTNSAGTPLKARHVLVTGEKYAQQSPFAGTEEALRSMPDMGVAKYDFVDDIVFVNRMPLDRAGQILSMGWYWIGGYAIPTDATINSTVLPSASAARYKRAVAIQVASSR